jgi:protocatechuate 3,4-dioxygenase beta subunit
MSKLAIQVLMYPHDSRPINFQQFSWHRPASLRLQLKPVSKGKGSPATLVTGSQGVATGQVKPGTYTVELPDLVSAPGGQRFFYRLTIPAGGAAKVAKPRRLETIAVGGASMAAELHLFPGNGYWLVPLRLKIGAGAKRRATGLNGAQVTVTDSSGTRTYTSVSDGHVFATSPADEVTVEPVALPSFVPESAEFLTRADREQECIDVSYRPIRARITITPGFKAGGGSVPGVTFELSRPGQGVLLSQVSQGSQACVFDDITPGQVTVKATPPAPSNGSPIVLTGKSDCVSVNLAAGDNEDLSKYFQFKYTTGSISGRVVDQEGQPIAGVTLVASLNGQSKTAVSSGKGKYSIGKLRPGPWTLVPQEPTVQRGSQTLIVQPSQHVLVVQAGQKTKADDFTMQPDEHGIRGQVTDNTGQPLPNAVVEIRNERMRVIDTVVADAQGNYSWLSPSSGRFVVNLLTRDGRTVQRQAVTVNSWAEVDLMAEPERPDIAFRADPPGGGGVSPSLDSSAGVNGSSSTNGTNGRTGSTVPEAVTDLAAYPVLTEEVSTTGVPAPAGGGFGRGGSAGAGYGQIVDQAMRDVLGWRPGGDPSGFQAALAGAFQLKEKEGHTEWTWQQRGYAVQADMGALTGAQASIYARAKSALDQMLPLLAGLTPLNPALFPEQDREAIRTVVTTELQELVAELALEGGPRTQRVDELFGLLAGDNIGTTNLNPDVVQGQLGTLRQRFALTTDWIETVDDERVVTNFRVVVDQVLALQASWSTDRDLLAVIDSRSALGTILIWLSRGLEAVCESVGDLTFALDSVYIDAAQRQVIEFTFASGQPPLLLSDLLDWVVQATRDEGPRLIQDAGKDGVRAFAPVLHRLRGLVEQAIKAAATDHHQPPGLRTPRVKRAFEVLHDQLREANRLAGLVKLDQPPVISLATPEPLGSVTGHPHLTPIAITGTGFRAPASAVLEVVSREDVPDVLARNVQLNGSTAATATFRIPHQGPGSHRANWQLVFINGDGTQSAPFPVHI